MTMVSADIAGCNVIICIVENYTTDNVQHMHLNIHI